MSLPHSLLQECEVREGPALLFFFSSAPALQTHKLHTQGCVSTLGIRISRAGDAQEERQLSDLGCHLAGMGRLGSPVLQILGLGPSETLVLPGDRGRCWCRSACPASQVQPCIGICTGEGERGASVCLMQGYP